MGSSLKAWLEKEQAAAEERKQKERKRIIIGMILLVPGSILVLVLIGWLSAGEISAAVGNIKYGIIFAVCCEVILLPFTFVRNPAKRYMKLLKREIEEQLPTSGQQEDFASQMLGELGSDSVRDIWCRKEYKKEEWVSVTRDYALMRYLNGMCVITRLKDVQRIELDRDLFIININSGKNRTHVNTYSFPINFFYRSQGEGNKKKPDKVFAFDERKERDKVMKAIQELCDV